MKGIMTLQIRLLDTYEVTADQMKIVHINFTGTAEGSETFAVIWKRMGEWRTDELYPLECRECTSFSSCRGACRADALADTGTCKGMDTAARLEWLPLSFQKKKMTFPQYEKEARFSFRQDAHILEEREGYRISHWGQHVFVTEKAMRFFSSI